MEQLQLSPDGKTLGYIVSFDDGSSTLCFRDLATKKVIVVDPDATTGSSGAYINPGQKAIVNFSWITDARVVFTTTSWDYFLSGQSAVNRDGTHWQGLSGGNRKQNWTGFYGQLTHYFEDKSGFIYTWTYDLTGKPTVYQVNTWNGTLSPAVLNPGKVDIWEADHRDRVRIGIINDGSRTRVLYRADDRSPWENMPDFDSDGPGYYPVGFGYDEHTLYVAVKTRAGTWGLYTYDAAKRKLGQLVCADPHYDILNPHDNPAGTGLIFSQTKQKLIGVRYAADWLRTVWFDPEMATYQEAIDQALPNTINEIVMSRLDYGGKFMVLAYNERDPGTYYLFDPKNHALDKFAVSSPWIDPAKMAEMLPITYRARDGLVVHAYLTLPPGTDGKHLPLVVYPHGGPFMRDVLHYDPTVQFLASRGYAVLQVNYRGSPGYGEAFYRAGWKEVGRAIQDDITDGVKAVVAGGVADPKRVAIFGVSYGGYSALWAMENTPELYRCGISLAGVTDWESILGENRKSIRLGEYRVNTDELYRYWKQKVGDPATDEANLKAISPLYHVDRIKAPVFIIQGTEDRTVPESQARRFVSALKDAGRPYESWFVRGEGHSMFRPKDRAELYRRIEAFLAKNMQ